MDNKEFLNQLNNIRELIAQEKYTDAIVLINNLKEIEKTNDFDYNLTHQLYQLDSNSRSLYNQKIILKYVQKITIDQKSITFHELNQIIKENKALNLSDDILRREIEILVLRDRLFCKLDGERIILKTT
ncbi:hypothetical protein LCGC14_1229020 [marine sediment metagenome]|uniref:PCI domain-containing protein n=1 Tax=marine sediment metagenome TaxID=412755 RepID=A0A0F9NRD4_9ZZZZ